MKKMIQSVLACTIAFTIATMFFFQTAKSSARDVCGEHSAFSVAACDNEKLSTHCGE